MFKKPKITLRFGASHNDITVDGHTFDRGALSKKELSFVRNVVIDSLVKSGAVNRRAAA